VQQLAEALEEGLLLRLLLRLRPNWRHHLFHATKLLLKH
jgi:hypothetical protein